MWKGTPGEREFCSMLSGCCSHPEFGLDFTFGRLVDTGLQKDIPAEVFAEVVQQFSRRSCWSWSSASWESISETTLFFQPSESVEHAAVLNDPASSCRESTPVIDGNDRNRNPPITDWHNRTLNETRRYRKKSLRFLQLSLGGTYAGVEIQSSAYATYDMAQPLAKPLSRVLKLRQRRTFVLSNFVRFHCDLLSAACDMDNPVHMQESFKKKIHERRLSFEIAQFTAHNVHLIHEHMESFLTHVQRFLVQDLKLFSGAFASLLHESKQLTNTDSNSSQRVFSLLAQDEAKKHDLMQAKEEEDVHKQAHKEEELLLELVPLVQQFRGRGRDPCEESELEGRLGRQVQNEKGQAVFVSGVSRNHFFWLLTLMEEYKNWCNVDHRVWTDSADLFWDNVRGTKTRDTSDQTPMIFITKDAVSAVTWSLTAMSTRLPASHHSCESYSARVSRKTEKRLDQRPRAYVTTPPVVYRFKRRRSFVFRNKWRYDFTIVGDGVTDEDAFRAPKRYEVEIEALRLEKSNEDEAFSLVEKLRQLGSHVAEFDARLYRPNALV